MRCDWSTGCGRLAPPKQGQKGKKFVEALAALAPEPRYDNAHKHPAVGSITTKRGAGFRAETLKKAFLNFDPTQVLTGDEVDKTEQEIARLCPSLKRKKIREFSYANLLYKEIRCGYAHEYAPGERAESWVLGVPEAPVCYLNKVIYSNNETIRSRSIHFRVEWIADVAITIASAVDAMEPLESYPKQTLLAGGSEPIKGERWSIWPLFALDCGLQPARPLLGWVTPPVPTARLPARVSVKHAT